MATYTSGGPGGGARAGEESRKSEPAAPPVAVRRGHAAGPGYHCAPGHHLLPGSAGRRPRLDPVRAADHLVAAAHRAHRVAGTGDRGRAVSEDPGDGVAVLHAAAAAAELRGHLLPDGQV